MKLHVKRTKELKGEVAVPASKSHTVRALLFASLAKGKSVIKSPLISEDTKTAIQACEAIGAKITWGENALIVESHGLPLQTNLKEIFTGNSGITSRFVLPLLGLQNNNEVISLQLGEQMRKRPMQPLIDALSQLGMRIEEKQQLIVSGQLKGGHVRIDGTSSQYLSALLIALPCAENDSTIEVENLNERPYVEMTLAWLKELSIKYSHKRSGSRDLFQIPGQQSYKPFVKRIPEDRSSAVIIETAMKLVNSKSALPNQKQIDLSDDPDSLPIFAVLASQTEGETRLTNVKHARIKETDRIRSMAISLKEMGADLEELPDGLTIRKSKLKGAHVHGFNDHRTVMALAVAGLVAEGETVIDTAECITKTFPSFVKQMQSLGAKMSLELPSRIILIGFKSSGKTSLGKKLAERHEREFFDLDEVIENDEMMTCREIVKTKGEDYFRKKETEKLKELLRQENCIIALGGGATLSAENQNLLENETCVHVQADQQRVFQRIKESGRPASFPQGDLEMVFKELWEKSQPTYKKLASFSLDSTLDNDFLFDEEF